MEKDGLTSQCDELKHLKPPFPVQVSLNVSSSAIFSAFVYLWSLDIVAVGGIVSVRQNGWRQSTEEH